MKPALMIGSVVLLAIVFLIPTPQPGTDPPSPDTQDLVEEAFNDYESLWRKHAAETAEKLDSGDLKTEQEAWDYLAKGQEPARRVAFDEIAKHEQKFFTDNGGWSASNHSKLLKGYAK